MPSSHRFSGPVTPSQRSVAIARKAMVCTSQQLATSAAIGMLRAGGNAVDAAVSAAAVLGVVEPYNTGMGGDCFVLLWNAREQRLFALNGSGRAPAAATLDAMRSRGVSELPPQGILTVTVPGTVDAWSTALERFGRLSLAQVLEPAIGYADEGFPVSEVVAHEWDLVARFGMLRNPAALQAFTISGEPPRVGQVMRFPDLAASFRAIAAGGRDAFYRGEIAARIVALSHEEGGFLELEDLAEHRSTWVEPISVPYRGYELVEMPPSTQGITALLALGILSHFEIPSEQPDATRAHHLRIESVKSAFSDRNAYVADPEQVYVPVAELLSAEYTRRRAAAIDVRRAAPSVAPGLGPRGGSDTVVLTTADEEGNVVCLINSLYGAFGSGLVVPGTGITLQNRGRGFSLDPRHPSCLAPRKRPFHTLCPAMLLRDGRPAVSFGVMGGDVQAQAHVQVVSYLVDHELSIQEALDRPRFHYLDGARVSLEGDFSPHVPGELAAMGHDIADTLAALARGGFGGGQGIAIDAAAGTYWGGSDRRKDGCALGF